MAVILQAPANLIQTVTVLPSPTIGDNYAPKNTVNVLKSMNGTVRTYIKKPSTYKIIFSFKLDLMKAYELFAFIKEYNSTLIRLIDHHDRIWEGNIISNPVEIRKVSEKIKTECNIESVSVTLEFSMRKL